MKVFTTLSTELCYPFVSYGKACIRMFRRKKSNYEIVTVSYLKKNIQ